MLTEALVALAAAGGTAVVQAAGTDAWSGLRQRVAQLLGRGDADREQVELDRLEQTAAALEAAGDTEAERVQIRHETAWQTRFEALLETLNASERQEVETELRALLANYAGAAAGVSTQPGGVAAGRDVVVRADGGIAGGVISGGAHIGTPRSPDPSKG
ncbi:hypothetical protein [Streptomyces sp. NPDC055013]